MQASLINNAVASVNDTVDIVATVPAESVRWAASNVAYCVLLGLCIYAHVLMDNNEAQFLTNLDEVYHDVNDVWTYVIFSPISAIVALWYGTVVPIFNLFFVPVNEAFWAALETLTECSDPMIFLNAFLAVPASFGKLAHSFVNVFDTQGGQTSWMVNAIDISSVITYFQEHVLQPIINNADCLCDVLTPTVHAVGDVLLSPNIATSIDAIVNTVWRMIQVPFHFAAPQYKDVLNVVPVFDELRKLGFAVGGMLDDMLHAFIIVATENKDALLPKPSLGMAVGRAWGGVWSAVEIPFDMLAAAVGQKSVYDASDAKVAANHLFLSVQALAAGMHALMSMVTTGSAGKASVLTCNSYDFDFYKTHDINFPEACLCVPGTCGTGDCSARGDQCECQNGAVHAVADDLLSKCVQPCAFGTRYACNAAFETDFELGTCTQAGQCICNEGAQLDVRTGRCSASTPQLFVYNSSKPNCALTKTTGPPLPCTLQSAGHAAVGLAYTSYSLLRELILRFPPQHTPWTTLQTFDGKWYSRFDSVTCEYRKSRTDDFMIHTDNCVCEPPPGDDLLTEFDPWCGQPTLNANVYNHLDALAFYAGFWTEIGFFGGMGMYRTFLTDSFGLAATSAARLLVEGVRIVTHVISGFITYAKTMAAALTSDPTGAANLLQLPMNCHWGAEFDGPLVRKYDTVTEIAVNVELQHFKDIKCRTSSDCSDKVRTVLDSWSRVSYNGNFNRLQPDTQLDMLNDMNLAHVIYTRHQQNTCRKQAHLWGSKECTVSNDDDGCYCSVHLTWEPGYQCRCVAFYPVAIDDDKKSRLYDLPWCHSMLLEWSYYRILEVGVAANNLLARLDSSNPVSAKIDSPCYDGSEEYLLSQTHSVIKAFQPNDKGGFSFIGNQNAHLENVTICNALAKADRGNPQWIHFEDGQAHYPDQQPSLQERQAMYKEAPTQVYAAEDVDWKAFNEKYPGPQGGAFSELTDKVFRLHPQTCGYAAGRDQFVFQPCAHECITAGGNNRCWCDVKVSQDITCNVGDIIQRSTYAAVDMHRQLSSAALSVAGLIQGGMRIGYAQTFCDLSRVIGSMCGTVASVLTGQIGGQVASSIRFRIASLLFTIFDTAVIMPLGLFSGNMYGDNNIVESNSLEDSEGMDALQAAAIGTMYQDLFQDIFSGQAESAAVATASLAGSLVANSIVLEVKFGCIMTCNVMDGIQHFIFAHDVNAPGADIIPAVENFIDIIIKVLDETYTHLVVMSANMVAGFVGLMTGGPPSIGEWLSNALEVLQEVARTVNGPENMLHFVRIIISLLPDSIRPIIKALMSTLCSGILHPLDVIVQGIKHIPFVGSVFPNPFAELAEQCLSPDVVVSGLDATGGGNRGFSRRLREEAQHWEGNTFCAHYGRNNHTHDELYDECVRNRHLVHNLRQVTGRTYFPWTIMDDWKQPVTFVLQTLHGVALYYSIGESHMREWSRAGYPVDASIDVVHLIRGMRFPETSIRGIASAIPRIYPDFATNNRSTGYHLLRVLDTIERTSFPEMRNLPWGSFHDSAHDAVVSMSTALPFHSSPAPSASPPPPPAPWSRRLYAAVTYEKSRPTVSSPVLAADDKQCPVDDAGNGACLKCAFLDKFLVATKHVASSTATYYSEVYPKQVDYFAQVISYAHRPGARATSKEFSFVRTNQYAHKSALPFTDDKPAQVAYQSHEITEWPTAQNIKDFLLPTTNIHVPVPFFKHSLWYYLQYPLKPCDTVKMAYESCDQPQYTVSDSAVMTLHMAVAYEVLSWMTQITLPYFVVLPLYAMSFMIFRYNYVPRCLPVLPWCLVIDLQTLVENTFPPYLCELVPGLVTSGCSAGTQAEATYRSCPRNELGMLNPIFFWLRWKVPALFVTIFSTDDWGPAITTYLHEIREQQEVTPLQTSCFYLAAFDVVIIVVAAMLAARLIVPLMRVATKSVITSAGSLAIAGPFLLSVNDDDDEADVPKVAQDAA